MLSLIFGPLACEVAPHGDDEEGAEGRDEVIKNNPEAAAPATALEGLVCPTNRLRFGGVKITKQEKGYELRPKTGGRDEPKNQPKGQNLVPDYATRISNAQITPLRCRPTSR